ncbi:MAG: NusG domain II-containing protein [Roseburia sp.]|nr:NusG domain II-containing protein [Roseburia sp.]
MVRKKDGILIACVIVIAAVLALLRPRDAGKRLRITIDGAVYGEYMLSEDQTIELYSKWGYNQVIIREGAAYMASADCPDRYCVAHEPISKGGQAIICLPHRLVAEVLAAENGMADEVDAVSQ